MKLQNMKKYPLFYLCCEEVGGEKPTLKQVPALLLLLYVFYNLDMKSLK